MSKQRSRTASFWLVRAPVRLARPLPHRGSPAMLLVASHTTSATALLSWELEDKVNRAVFRRVALIGAMVAIVAVVAGVAYWDAARESAAALQEFAQEQGTLAAALGSALRVRAANGRPSRQSEVLAEMRSVERTRSLAILLHRPGDSTFHATDGRMAFVPQVGRSPRQRPGGRSHPPRGSGRVWPSFTNRAGGPLDRRWRPQRHLGCRRRRQRRTSTRP